MGLTGTTLYAPEPTLRTFLERANPAVLGAEVSVAVLDAVESRRVFRVPLPRQGLQPVFVRVANQGEVPLRLQVVAIDPQLLYSAGGRRR